MGWDNGRTAGVLLLIDFDFCVAAAELAEIDALPVNRQIMVVYRADDVVQAVVRVGDPRDDDGAVLGVGKFPRRLIRFRRHSRTEGVVACFLYADDAVRGFEHIDDGGFVDRVEKFDFELCAVRTIVAGVDFPGLCVPDDERVAVPHGNEEEHGCRKNKQGRSDNRCGRCLFIVVENRTDIQDQPSLPISLKYFSAPAWNGMETP